VRVMEHEAISFPNDMCTRRVPREDTVRIVEYTPFPRAARQQARVGFTRDLSTEDLSARTLYRASMPN